MSSVKKERLDVLLVEAGLAPTRARAHALVLAGQVVVGEQRVDKPGTRVPVDAALRLKGETHPYVSRGGVKLRHALDTFHLEVAGAVAADVGASTGGFTDVLLRRGATRVVGIDVDREKIKLFTLMGFLAACAAVMLTLENKNYFGNQGQGYLLTAIASVLIGGTSIFGGRATIVGTVFGCFIIGMIEAGLVASGLTGAWVRTVQGLIFLISIIFYLYADEPQRRRNLFARFGRFQSFGRMRSAE